jgi:negative regulator of replication initiation
VGIQGDKRTTLNLDDDVFQMARSYANSRSLSLGKAVSELLRRGLRVSMHTRTVNGVQVVDLPPDSPRIITRRVKELLSGLD